MSKVNSLFQDKQEEMILEWMLEHPGSDEEDAFYALGFDVFDPPPQRMEG